MAGHSKWANIRHKKQKEDAKRGKIFTKLARQITVAAREGGGDPNSNFRLRLAIDMARSHNMPNDNIERAIKRGTGELEGSAYEEFVYEGYGPGGVAILLEVMTDNRNRTASDVRHLFSKNGGNLGESGCVAWMFETKGQILVEADGVDEDEIILAALEAGAEDVELVDDLFEVVTAPEALRDVQSALSEAGYTITEAGVRRLPTTTVNVNAEEGERLIALIEALEDHDDIQQVYANAEFSEEVMEALGQA